MVIEYVTEDFLHDLLHSSIPRWRRSSLKPSYLSKGAPHGQGPGHGTWYPAPMARRWGTSRWCPSIAASSLYLDVGLMFEQDIHVRTISSFRPFCSSGVRTFSSSLYYYICSAVCFIAGTFLGAHNPQSTCFWIRNTALQLNVWYFMKIKKRPNLVANYFSINHISWKWLFLSRLEIVRTPEFCSNSSNFELFK